MNRQRRAELAKLGLEGVVATFEVVRDNEQEAYDNMPESLQDSERGSESQEWIDAIEEALSGLETLIGKLAE